MSRYIDADAVMEILYLDPGIADFQLEMIQNLPTADVAPVKHGRWETDDDGDIYCSCCEDFWDSSLERIIKIRFEYCPYCGAHMEGAEDV